jgi:hypothetical protein
MRDGSNPCQARLIAVWTTLDAGELYTKAGAMNMIQVNSTEQIWVGSLLCVPEVSDT